MPPTSSPTEPSDQQPPGPRARSRRKAGVFLLVLAPVVLAATIGWSLGHDEDAGATRPADAAELTALRNSLPLQALLNSSPDAARRAHRAEQSLIAACMTDRGVRYDKAPDPAPAGSETAGTTQLHFGIESVGPTDGEAAAGSQRPPAERRRDKAFDLALYGDPEKRISARNKAIRVTRPATGCLAEAQTRLLGGKDARRRDLDLRLVLDQGERDASAALADDPGLRTADADWSACMADQGVKAATPARFAQRLPEGTDLATDPSVAADLDCKRRTDYLERAYGRLAALQRNWLDRHAEDADAWRSLRVREAKEADEVLGSRAG
ncbi:hypothetical protein ABT026_18200 [Streptomyces sp. NPDC002734]|uniref:hypothetical protein n=1 Tax=Streptomyces sp. NPDC002734 TaxID=3154426 RepID=UPI00332C06CC